MQAKLYLHARGVQQAIEQKLYGTRFYGLRKHSLNHEFSSCVTQAQSGLWLQ